jgi:ribosomal protein L7/L12
MTLETILIIVSAVLTGAAALFGFKFTNVKKKFKQIVTLVKEASDVLSAANEALGDNRIDKAEADKIKKEITEMIGAFKVLIGKG